MGYFHQNVTFRMISVRCIDSKTLATVMGPFDMLATVYWLGSEVSGYGVDLGYFDQKVTFRPSNDRGMDFTTRATVYGLGSQISGDEAHLGYPDQNLSFRPSSGRGIDYSTLATVYGLANQQSSDDRFWVLRPKRDFQAE